jgi:hypothetical protein
MSRPAHAGPAATLDNRAWLPAMTTLHDEIQTLLDGPPAPSLASLEETLTSGYAHVLGLESERLRIERRLRELVRAPGPRTGEHNRRIADLAAELGDADRDLQRFRALLATLRRHVRSSAAPV